MAIIPDEVARVFGCGNNMSNTSRQQKIKRHLVKADLESLLALYKKLTGRDATPEEIARFRLRLRLRHREN
jgi:hypothetical protein